MEEIISKETTTTSTAETSAPQTIAPVSPVQQVAESSTTEYSRPIETQPTLTYTEAIVSRIPALTSEPATTDKPTVTAETRPLVVNNLMIDPVAGTTTALTSLGMPQTGGGAVGGGTFGGGGGGGVAPESSAKTGTIAKKSWLPIILIVAGIIVLLKKTKKAQKMTETLNTETVSEQLSLPTYSDKQIFRFRKLCERVKNREITANQAYKYSQIDGDGDDDKGFKGSLKEWIVLAQDKGWLDVPEQNNTGQLKPPAREEEKKETNYLMPILIGAGVAIVLIYAIRKFSKTE